MNIDLPAASRPPTPTIIVHPRTVVMPRAAAVITAASHFGDATAQPELPFGPDEFARVRFIGGWIVERRDGRRVSGRGKAESQCRRDGEDRR